MEKKSTSKPMNAILKHLERYGEFEIVYFKEAGILHKPVDEWPHPVDVLICFYSEGFPLDKAQSYVSLRKPHCINNVTAQRILLDRRLVYAVLGENGIPHPKAVVVERDPQTGELLGAAAQNFVEADDFIIVGDSKVDKPFVEKPVNAEDHNICIYYPSSAGGGMKSLFRKVGDKSATFDPHVQQVRRDGAYMYEPFMKTGGTDIKVYTVGPTYAHAEARKSPVIDGLVNRDKNGKEVRFPVVLTPPEKEIARKICLAFGQTVCGFDLLRTTSGSYVIDVNGWSFVKGVNKYYEDAAKLLRAHMLQNTHILRRHRHNVPRTIEDLSGVLAAHPGEQCGSCAVTEQSCEGEDDGEDQDRWKQEELLAVLAIMRHGDRTPKNKTKLKTRRQEFLDLHRRWAGSPKKEAKLKAPKQLQEVLDLTCDILAKSGHPCASTNSEELRGAAQHCEDKELEGWRVIRAVLEEGGHFHGINRKVQLKPTSWNACDEVEEVLIVLKYGGIITPAGVAQAETLGQSFRSEMYPSESVTDGAVSDDQGTPSSGLLRLHATQRHDFKVYSSDEGRVQMSAAAFTRGLLDLEAGVLTPICVALVETDPAMLDDLPHEAEPFFGEAKIKLHERITGSPISPPQDSLETAGVQSMQDELAALRDQVHAVCNELGNLDKQAIEVVNCGPGKCKAGNACDHDEQGVGLDSQSSRCCRTARKPLLVMSRWYRLREDLWDSKRGMWNISKVPEIYDAVKYDLIHHKRLATSFTPLYAIAKKLNNVIVPNEYGHDEQSRTVIGATVCDRLLRKLLADLNNSINASSAVEVLPKTSLVTAVQYLKRSLNDVVSSWLSQGEGQEQAKEPSESENCGHHEDECKEVEFAGLDPEFAESHILNPKRRVRTRLYFTSESHIQSLMNVLRYCHRWRSGRKHVAEDSDAAEDGQQACHPPTATKEEALGAEDGIVCPEAEARLQAEPVFDYLTQIVFRLYEDKKQPASAAERYRVEVLFSPGAIGDPSGANGDTHTMPLDKLLPLHLPGKPLTLERLVDLIGPFAGSAGGAQGTQVITGAPSCGNHAS